MTQLTKPINAEDHHLGASEAPVTLLEYGDFQCPDCGAAFPVLQEVLHEMGDQMEFIFRHFPLTQIHEYAQIAAEAAEAAAAQGKFWQMHHQIFTHQNLLDLEHLYEFGRTMDLDMERFDEDLQKHTFREKVRADFMSGVRSGVSGTPTLFINGTLYNGAVETQDLIQTLKGEVNNFYSAIDEKKGKG